MQKLQQNRSHRLIGYFKILLLSILIAPLLISNAAASELSTAKAAGLIGEKANGYLGLVVTTAAAATKNLVVDINNKRKAHYQTIATKNAISLSNVEQMAGKKAISKTLAGQYIQSNSGVWKKK